MTYGLFSGAHETTTGAQGQEQCCQVSYKCGNSSINRYFLLLNVVFLLLNLEATFHVFTEKTPLAIFYQLDPSCCPCTNGPEGSTQAHTQPPAEPDNTSAETTSTAAATASEPSAPASNRPQRPAKQSGAKPNAKNRDVPKRQNRKPAAPPAPQPELQAPATIAGQSLPYSEWYGFNTKRKPYAPSKYICPAWPTERGPKKLKWVCKGGLCGGWGDRTRGMIGGFFLALVSNRSFAIEVTFPNPLELFYEPNMEDWTNKTFLEGAKERYGHLDRHWSVKETQKVLKFQSNIELSGNILMWIQLHELMTKTNSPDAKVPGAAYSANELGLTDLKWPYGCAYRHLFKRLIEPLRNDLAHLFATAMKDNRRPIISLHIRTIRKENMQLEKYAICAEKLEKMYFNGRKAYWFVAADNQKVRTEVSELFAPKWPDRVVHIVNATVGHIDMGNKEFRDKKVDSHNNKRASEKYMHMESWILVHSDALVVGYSGFAWCAGSVHLQKRTHQYLDCSEGERWF